MRAGWCNSHQSLIAIDRRRAATPAARAFRARRRGARRGLSTTSLPVPEAALASLVLSGGYRRWSEPVQEGRVPGVRHAVPTAGGGELAPTVAVVAPGVEEVLGRRLVHPHPHQHFGSRSGRGGMECGVQLGWRRLYGVSGAGRRDVEGERAAAGAAALGRRVVGRLGGQVADRAQGDEGSTRTTPGTRVFPAAPSQHLLPRVA